VRRARGGGELGRQARANGALLGRERLAAPFVELGPRRGRRALRVEAQRREHALGRAERLGLAPQPLGHRRRSAAQRARRELRQSLRVTVVGGERARACA
jgi:hypothetical protein